MKRQLFFPRFPLLGEAIVLKRGRIAAGNTKVGRIRSRFRQSNAVTHLHPPELNEIVRSFQSIS